MQSPQPQQRRSYVLAIIVAAVFVALSLGGSLARFYTDLLWFRDLGQTGVFWTTFWSRLATGAFFTAVMFLLLYVNGRIARRMAPRTILMAVEPVPDQPFSQLAQLEEFFAQVRQRLDGILNLVLLGASLVLAFVFGWGMSRSWHLFQLAFNRASFGATDPQFGKEIGFFVFSLPALRAIETWTMGALVVTLLFTLAVHLVDGAIRPWAKLRGFAPHVKAHISVLMALIVTTKAFDYWLRIWELDFSPRGQVTGASYTDVHAQLPAYRILIVITLLSAVVLLLNIRQQGWRLPVIAVGVWVVAAVVIGAVYPQLVQQLRVKPNEVKAESPYIRRNILGTREAFGLTDVEGRSFPALENLTAKDIRENKQTVDNVRLWDPGIVAQSYQQLQGLRTYYDFSDVDVDRYRIGDERKQVLLSVREMNIGGLAATARTWVNQHLVYTHGYGLVMSPVSVAGARGTPQFIIRDLPPTSTVPGLAVTRPEVYFGEQEGNYVVVRTGIREFDYPVADQNATTIYEGKAGVPVGNILRRLAFAVRFGSLDLLLSSYVTPESKVLFDRSLAPRLERLAPWLERDGDPYPVLLDGRIVWVIDGYTSSMHYPYSERLGDGTNYMRNSVKVTVDAYDGTTTLYAFDEKDPVLKAWRGVFPGLVKPASDMPDGVREHLRYPEGLFNVQASVYAIYHMQDPQVFYNKEDSWNMPKMPAYYVLMDLPGETRQDFMIMMPFTPRNKDNMIAWMAAKSDPEDYGRRVVYRFPKQKTVLGPDQVSARINQDPVISPQITLWSQRGSEVKYGNMLVIPINESIVYIQPLYLQAEQTAMPELTRVIVVYGDRLAMESSLSKALLAVFGEEPTAEPTTTPTPGETGGGTADDAATAARLYRDALAAQQRGDWAEYGRLIRELGTVLERLAGSGSRVATPTP